MIDEIKTWIGTCPYLDDGRVINIDYLHAEASYSIEPLTCDPYIKRFVDGGGIKQFQVALTSRELYDDSADQNSDNAEFYEKFAEWVEEQNESGTYPFTQCTGVQVLTNGYLFDSDSATARYQIQLAIYFERKGN